MTRRRARPGVRAALCTAVLATAFAVSGCTAQPVEANDNGPQPDPTQPGDVIRTPAPVEEAPIVVDEVPAEKQAEVPEAEEQTEGPEADTEG